MVLIGFLLQSSDFPSDLIAIILFAPVEVINRNCQLMQEK
jgi:hypothetical protein